MVGTVVMFSKQQILFFTKSSKHKTPIILFTYDESWSQGPGVNEHMKTTFELSDVWVLIMPLLDTAGHRLERSYGAHRQAEVAWSLELDSHWPSGDEEWAFPSQLHFRKQLLVSLNRLRLFTSLWSILCPIKVRFYVMIFEEVTFKEIKCLKN